MIIHVIVVVVPLVKSGFMQNVAGNDGNWTMGEDACLNQGLFGAQNVGLQTVSFMIVHTARIVLRDGVIANVVVRNAAPQMHNAAVDVIFLN